VSSPVVFCGAMSAVGQKIWELIESGWSSRDFDGHANWRRRVRAFLARARPSDAGKFEEIKADMPHTEWGSVLSAEIGFLEALAAEADDADGALAALSGSPAAPVARQQSKRVFVVHGHDNEAKETVARFLERLGLEPVILHEQPNEGRTVVEKFEHHADVGFAVVLLTPDDVGEAAAKKDKLQPRARQNVVLELGYFMGALRRSRVCALYKGGVEIPSDYNGVLYVELDEKGAWRTRLAQELANAGLKINLEALLKS
jgi:predicted nucleotide-binding protein